MKRFIELSKKATEQAKEISKKAAEQVKIGSLELQKKLSGTSSEINPTIKNTYKGKLGHWLTNDEIQHFKQCKALSDKLYKHSSQISLQLYDIYRDKNQEKMLSTKITLQEYNETAKRVKINAKLAGDHYKGESFSHGHTNNMIKQFSTDRETLEAMNKILEPDLKDEEKNQGYKKSIGSFRSYRCN